MGKRVELVAEVTGTVWRIEREVGARVVEGDALLIVESMKMEIPVEAPCAGTVLEIRCAETGPVREGDVVAVIQSD